MKSGGSNFDLNFKAISKALVSGKSPAILPRPIAEKVDRAVQEFSPDARASFQKLTTSKAGVGMAKLFAPSAADAVPGGKSALMAAATIKGLVDAGDPHGAGKLLAEILGDAMPEWEKAREVFFS